MEMVSYFRDSVPREWTFLYEGIAAATTTGDLFRVSPVLAGMYSRFEQLFNIPSTAVGVGNPINICTDGEQIYYQAGGLSALLVAASPFDGSEIWEGTAGVAQFISICTDGTNVYGSATAADPGLIKVDRDTGLELSRGGVEYECSLIRANGEYAVGISPNSSALKLVFWLINSGATAPTETGTVSPTTLHAVAIDADSAYVGGVQAGGNDVWSFDLATRANNWQKPLPVTTPPTVAYICTDGDCVYVATERKTLSAGGNASVFCLDRVNGSTLWTYDIPDATDASWLAVDDRYLFVVDSANKIHMIKLRSPEPALVATAEGWNEAQCDGVSVIGTDSGTATNFMRHWLGGATKTYMRARGDDPERRPFYTLAVPVDGRI
jgi:outer membrane protein assembly factor BamB